MAQLQSLFTNTALGLRRLEAEEEAATAFAEQPAICRWKTVLAEQLSRSRMQLTEAPGALAAKWLVSSRLAPW